MDLDSAMRYGAAGEVGVWLRYEEMGCWGHGGGGGAVGVLQAEQPIGHGGMARARSRRRGAGAVQVSGSESRVQPSRTGEKLLYEPRVDFHPLDAWG
jgi:hypothetical protein